MIDTGAIRRRVIQLALSGAMNTYDSSDEPVCEHIKRVVEKRNELIESGTIKKVKMQGDITEVPQSVPDYWMWIRLNDYLDVRDGTHDSPKYHESGFPLVTSKNLKNGVVDMADVQLISKEDYDSINQRSKVDEGDILFAMIGSIGNPAIVKDEPEYAIKNVALFKKIHEEINEHFIYLYLLLAQEYMREDAKGGLQPFVSLGYLRNYPIPLPPLAEQQRIVERVESIFSLLDEIDAAQAEYKKDFSSVVEKVITAAILGKLDDYSVEAESVSKAFPQLVELQESLKDENFQLPEQWLWARLSDIVPDGKINDGNWVLSADMVKAGPVKLIQLGNIGNRTYIEKGYKYLTEEHFKELNGRQIYKDYLLINRLVGDRMVACILPEIDGILMTAVDVCWIAPDEKYDLEYIMYALTSEYIQKKVKSLGRGVTRFRISKLNLIDIPFPLPPIAVQREIVSMIKEVQTLCS